MEESKLDMVVYVGVKPNRNGTVDLDVGFEVNGKEGLKASIEYTNTDEQAVALVKAAVFNKFKLDETKSKSGGTMFSAEYKDISMDIVKALEKQLLIIFTDLLDKDIAGDI
jgi:hypothetical protein